MTAASPRIDKLIWKLNADEVVFYYKKFDSCLIVWQQSRTFKMSATSMQSLT